MPAAPIAFGREFFEVDPRTTALVVIDMQNGFVAEGATYETPGARTMMPHLEKLLGFAREQHMPIIWTQSDHSAPFGGVMLKKFPTIREDKYLWKGQPSFELYEHMPPPEENEFRVVKHKYDAFFETDLDSILRNHRIRTIIIVGTYAASRRHVQDFSAITRSHFPAIATQPSIRECKRRRSKPLTCSSAAS